MTNICIGLLAHVDAGKTTLSESILYNTGTIRRFGRVDHRDSFLDSFKEERERGITIFSKQALFKLGEKSFTLTDTPGHADFSAETERALSVLDYAVMIISATDGIHGHDITLWKLFAAYRVPVIIFINKMDRPGTDKAAVLKLLKEKFGAGFIDFGEAGNDNASYASVCGFSEKTCEEIALLDEKVTESFLETGSISDADIAELIKERKLFPCCFGSALKNEGVNGLLGVLSRYAEAPEYGDTLAGKVFKITRDRSGKRIAHIKITGGVLRPKDTVAVHLNRFSGEKAAGREVLQAENGTDSYTDSGVDSGTVYEKAEQIFLYNGENARQISEASAGMAVAVSGLDSAFAGAGIGAETAGNEKLLVPLFTSRITAPYDTDIHRLYLSLKEIEEEIPETEVYYDSENGEINLRLMGEVQTDIIKELVKSRFGIDIGFGEVSVVYKETITGPVIGAGHFEPLKHYAEAHILIEPAEDKNGIETAAELYDSSLPLNYRKLILTHLEEKKYRGVLMGAELCGVRFTLISGKAHEKHTEGGDFREAVYRAVRQGLMKARQMGAAKLLEPYYAFELSVPVGCAGRAMTDLSKLASGFDGPKISGDEAVFKGRAAVSRLRGYAQQVVSYTGGFGRLSVSYGGYDSCADEEKVLAEHCYEPELDISDPSGSVFCSHGAGYYVPWNEADAMMHIDVAAENRKYGISGFACDYASDTGNADSTEYGTVNSAVKNIRSGDTNTGRGKDYDYLGAGLAGDKELEAIWSGTTGRNANKLKAEEKRSEGLMRRPAGNGRIIGAAGGPEDQNSDKKGLNGSNARQSIMTAKERVLLVDGYNIIFAWDELNEMAKLNIDSARSMLADILSNYQGFKGMTLILVFDAYKVKGGTGSVEKYHNIYIVYTKEAQTADAYIEKTVHENAKNMRVTVATNDGLEQTIVFGDGAQRMSARELHEAVKECSADIYREFLSKPVKLENRIGGTETL